MSPICRLVIIATVLTGVGYWRSVAVAVVFIAAALRCGGLDLIEFKGDQAIFLGAAEAALNGGQLPLVGPLDSLGMQAPPFIVYFYQATLYLWNAPALVAWAIGAANVVAVAIAYRAAGRPRWRGRATFAATVRQRPRHRRLRAASIHRRRRYAVAAAPLAHRDGVVARRLPFLSPPRR